MGNHSFFIYCTLWHDLPEASLEYWRDRRELLSREIAVGMSGCDTVLSRLPLVRPHRSQRDLRSASTPLQVRKSINPQINNQAFNIDGFFIVECGVKFNKMCTL